MEKESLMNRRLSIKASFLASISLGLLTIAAGPRAASAQNNTFPTPSGNVGIGTTSPVTKAHVAGTSATNVDVLTLENTDITSNTTRSVTQNFVGRDTVGNQKTIASIWAKVDQINANDGSLHFGTRNGNSFFSDRMMIDTNGNVGIGTAFPSNPFTVAPSVNIGAGGFLYGILSVPAVTQIAAAAELDGIHSYPSVTGAFTLGQMNAIFADGAAMTNGTSTVTTAIGLQVSSPTFGSANYGILQTGSARNSFGGNVGIGTTSPSEKLSISAGAIHVTNMGSAPTASAGEIKLFSNDVFGTGATLVTRADEYLFTTRSGGTNILTLRNSGNVGIGTTSPGSKLSIGAGGNLGLDRAAMIGFQGADVLVTTANMALYGDAANTIINVPSSGVIGFRVDNIEKVRIDASGNINLTGTINAKYQDVAEWVPASEQLSVGTVVVLDSTKSNQVTSSTVSYDTRVAGVVSAQPGIALGEKSEGKVLVATTGRVRVKVDATKGPIHIGDLLVTSDVPGVAMKSEAVNLGGVEIHRPGTLIGKALEPLEKGKGDILVLLSLQ